MPPTGWRCPFCCCWGLRCFSIGPIELAIVQDRCAGQRGTANGLYMGISFLITAVVTVSVGWLADQIGMQAALSVCALLGLLGTPLVFLLPAGRTAV